MRNQMRQSKQNIAQLQATNTTQQSKLEKFAANQP